MGHGYSIVPNKGKTIAKQIENLQKDYYLQEMTKENVLSICHKSLFFEKDILDLFSFAKSDSYFSNEIIGKDDKTDILVKITYNN